MTTVVAPHEATGSRYRRVPWSPRAWSQALYLAGGIPAQAAALLIPWVLVRWSGRWSFWSWPQWPVWLTGLAVMFLLIPVLTKVHRHRLRVIAGIEIPPQPPMPGWLTIDGIAARIRSQATWRQAGYHFLAAPALAGAAIAAVALWLAGIGYALAYVYGRALPPRGHAQARHFSKPGIQPAALAERPAWCVPDTRRHRGAARRAMGHRRCRLA